MNNLDPKLTRLLDATLEDIISFAGYCINAEKFRVVNLLVRDNNSPHPLVILSGVSMDEVIKFLISREFLVPESGSFGDAAKDLGFEVVPVVYSVCHHKEASPAIFTGSIPEIWDWVKSNGLLERYVERTPRISSDIGRIETLYDEQGDPQQVWIEQSSQLFQEAKAKFERGEFLIKVEKEFEQVSEQPKGLNLATPSLELDDYSDYLLNQERWRAEIEELLTTVCPSVEIRRNHKTAPDLYSIHEKEGENRSFAVLHTLMFVRFLRVVDERFSEGSELFKAWLKYLAVKIIKSS